MLGTPMSSLNHGFFLDADGRVEMGLVDIDVPRRIGSEDKAIKYFGHGSSEWNMPCYIFQARIALICRSLPFRVTHPALIDQDIRPINCPVLLKMLLRVLNRSESDWADLDTDVQSHTCT